MRCKDDKKVSRMILNKTSTYLNHAIIIFMLTIFALGYGLICLFSYLNENNNNFINNENVHMIMVEGKTENEKYRELNTSDYAVIQKLLSKEKSTFLEIPFFSYVGGSDYSTGEPIKIIGIDKNKSRLLGSMVMKDMVAYSCGNLDSQIELSVPIVEEKSDGGFVSHSDVRYSLKNYKKVYNKSAFTTLRTNHEDLKEIFVTEATFLKILTESKRIPEKTTNLYADDVKDYVSVESIFLYVDDVYSIEDFASLLNESGFDTTYTFKAFDSLGDSLKKSTVFFVLLIVALLVTSVSNVILSFINYLRVQQKDMGILKFYGFTRKRIYNIYRRNIDIIFAKIAIILFAYIVILGQLLLGIDYFKQYSLVAMAVIIMIFLIRFFVLHCGLRKIIKKDIIYLLKKSKEFE